MPRTPTVVSVTLISIIIYVCVVLSIAGSSSGQELQNYKSEFIGIQIDFPSSWMYTDSKEFPYVSFIPGNESKLDQLPRFHDVYLTVSKDWAVKYKNIPLNSYLEFTKSQIPLNSSYAEVGDPKRIMLNNGSAGYAMIIKSDVEKKQALIIAIVNNGTAYQIVYKTSISKYGQYLPAVLKVISSLKFIKN
jgi:hypothetical protein